MPLRIQAFHDKPVRAVAYAPDAVAVGSEVQVYALPKGELLCRLRHHEAGVNALAYSPVDDRLVSASFDKTAVLWDMGTGAVQHTLTMQDVGVAGVAIGADGREVATYGASTKAGGRVKLWRVDDGQPIGTLKPYCHPTSIAVHPDGEELAVGCLDDRVVRLDRSTLERRPTRARAPHVQDMVIGPRGRHALASDGGRVRLWDIRQGKLIKTFPASAYRRDLVAFSPDGRTIATTNEGRVQLWATATGAPRRSIATGFKSLTRVAFAPRGHQIVVEAIGRSGLWSVETGRAIVTFRPGRRRLPRLVFGPSGRYVAELSTSYDGRWRLRDLTTGRVRPPRTRRDLRGDAAQFSPDGRMLALPFKDGVELVSIPSGRTLATSSSLPTSVTS